MHSYNIRSATVEDAARIVEIYNHFVAHTAISFEESPVSPQDMAARVTKVQDANLPWLVAEHDGVVVGYAYATKWKERHAYRFSVECTVYAAADFRGKGAGRALYGVLFPNLKAAGCHAVIAGIALPNASSVRLHEHIGMSKVAHFPQVGFKFGQWHDVGNWQVVF